MILLLGYGISNKSVEKILIKKKIQYKIFDDVIHDISEDVLKDVDLIIRSPGISISHPLLMLGYEKKIHIISEIEFAYLENSKGKIVALTASNGKTSTLYFAYQILKHYYKDVIFIGNNGEPYSSYIDKINENTIVLLELSSFQLENTYSLKPFISCIINISENHLDKVANYKEYIDSKLNILKNAQNIIINKDDEILNKIIKENIIYISKNINDNYYYINNNFYFNDKCVINNFENPFLVGEHNKINLLFSIAICHKIGLSYDKIYNVINNIKGVKYRLEFLKDLDGVLIYNDGKSTTPNSCKIAIEAFDNRIIHLILGGRNKNLDFSILNKYKNVNFYAYGESRYEIAKALKCEIFDSFYDAYKQINAKKGEIVIFSPGCASFDQFKSYIERSKAFENYILNK